MNKELLESYRSKKEEIKELQDKLFHMYHGDSMIGSNTILNYNKGYPVPQAVIGVDWNKIDRTKKRYENRIEMLTKECEETEEFVEAIPDSLIRRIFRLYYIDGLSQCKVSKQVHISQSGISEKISSFLNSDKNDKKV